MRRLILAAVIASAALSPALAADTNSEPALGRPSCGKTVAECQKAFDDRGEQIAKLSQSVQNMQSIITSAETFIGTRALNDYFQTLAAQGAPPK